MRFFTYTASTHIDTGKQNRRLIKVASLTFSICVFFFSAYQIVTAQTIHIPDPGLRTAIELALGKEVGENITQADMASLQSLQVNNCHFLTLTEMGVWWRAKRWICQSNSDTFEYEIQDLTGLEFAVNLTELRFGPNQVSDVSALKNLTKLTYLDLGRNQIMDVAPLKNLTNLTHLFLGRNQISDVSSLKGLTNLTRLSLIYNQVSDVSPLEKLTELIELDFEGNRLSDVSSLKGLTNLTHLSLRKNEISDISALTDLTKLTYLSLRENQIPDVSPLKDLTNLTYLHIGFNYTISDLSPLKDLTNLIHLQLDHNRISDVSPLKDLTNLKHLDASDNEISDLSRLKDLTKLIWLDLDTNKNLDLSALKHFPNLTFLDIHDNAISDLTRLRDLTKLKRLDLDDNAISDVAPLKDLIYLTELDLSGNHISDVSPLKNLINLKVLDLSNNQISDFSPLTGLIVNLIEYDNRNQTVPTYKPEDVNRDGIVNIIDLVLIASNFHNPELEALSGMNIYPDVNNDGIVDVRDLVAVAAEMDATLTAPMLRKSSATTSILTAESLGQWIQLAEQLDIKVPHAQRGIAVLEQLLGSLTFVEGLPKETALLANYPNPFNPETWIPYQLASPAAVRISIYSADGKFVRRLDLGALPAGMYHSKSRAAYWDGRNALGEFVASGVYFYTLTAGDFTATGKMLIRK